VTVTRNGNQKHYQASRESPVLAELHGLVVKTVVVVDPPRALAPLAGDIDAAFVYGSVATGADSTSSDIDVMVLSKTVTPPELDRLVEIGQLKREAPSVAEFEALQRSGEVRLADAENKDLSLTSRFDLAYNGALALAAGEALYSDWPLSA